MRISAQVGSQATDQDHSQEIDVEAPSDIHMACVFQAGKLGIATYDTASAEVHHPPRDFAAPSASKGIMMQNVASTVFLATMTCL